MSAGLDRLKSGDFNVMSQEQQLDGSLIITLSKHGENKVYKLKVKDLYKPTEAVISDEEIKEGYYEGAV